MKTIRYMILAAGAVMALAACNKAAERDLLPAPSDGKVTVIFGVGPAGTQSTKAMAETPQITDLRIAVFGGSGYLKEYVKAEPVDEDGNALSTGGYPSVNGTDGKSWFKADLTPTDSRIRVHFIANGPETLPFKYEEDVIKALYTDNPLDGYWQRIIVPDGIQAKTDADGDYVDADGNKISSSAQSYVVAEETAAAFQDIVLIRNFAKIKVASTASNFTLKGFMVANVPDRGAISPYDGNTGKFIADYYPGDETAEDSYARSYNDFSYSEISALYPGYSVGGTEILPVVTEETTFSSFAAPTEAAFVYERPKPSALPTFVIVYGTYDGSDYYYKLNITDADNENIPILRNFQYTITLTSVAVKGYDTAIEAYEGTGSGGISSSTETTELIDISDGTSRIQVEYIEQVLTGGESTTLSFQFIRSTSAGYQASDNDQVTLTLGEAGSTGAVFSGNPVVDAADGPENWRQATIPLEGLGEQPKVQTVRVSGQKPDGTYLYRDITYRLMAKMDLAVRVPDEVPASAGTSFIVQVGLPKDIPSSIFPLPVKIESDAQTINPDNDNLPVESGYSIVEGRESKRSFAFVKTISYQDYKVALEEASTGDDKVWFDCHFKTIVEKSGRTTVYAANEYFNTASDSFVTYTQQYFTNLEFDPQTLTEEGKNFDFNFDLDSVVPESVTVTLFGAAPVDESQLYAVPNESGVYTYLPSSTETSVSLHLVTTNSYGIVSATLSAKHYETAENKIALAFTDLALSTFEPGIGAEGTFTFSYANGFIDPVTVTLENLAPADTETRLTANGDGTYTFTPTDSNASQTLALKATEGNAAVKVTISSSYYNEASAAGSYRNPYTFTSVSLQTPSAGKGKEVTFQFNYESGHIVPITVILQGLEPSLTGSTGTFTSLSSGTYLFTPASNASGDETQSLKLITTQILGTYSVSLNSTQYTDNTETIVVETLNISKNALKLKWNSDSISLQNNPYLWYSETEISDSDLSNIKNIAEADAKNGNAGIKADISLSLTNPSPTEDTIIYLMLGFKVTTHIFTTVKLGDLISGTSSSPYTIQF